MKWVGSMAGTAVGSQVVTQHSKCTRSSPWLLTTQCVCAALDSRWPSSSKQEDMWAHHPPLPNPKHAGHGCVSTLLTLVSATHLVEKYPAVHGMQVGMRGKG